MIKIKVFFTILLAELWNVSGQILYKKSVNSIETPNLRELKSYLRFVGRIARAPMIWLGLISIAVGIVIWLIVLAQVDLSLAFPIDSMQYIVTLVMAHYLLGERINKLKLFGTLLVVGGIVLVAIS